MPMPESTVTDKISDDDHKRPGLYHLRAFAISYVFLFHARIFAHPKWTETAGSFGWTGVDLFFVLSGFLIAGQLFSKIAKGKPILLKEFFLKRVFRIIPAYVTVVLLYFFFPALRERPMIAPLWRYCTFTFNIWLNRSQYNTFTHSWSLCVEEQFYLLFPAVLALCLYLKTGKKAVYIIITLFLAGFAVRAWSWYHLVAPLVNTPKFDNTWAMYIYYPTYTRLDGLLAGISLAAIFTFYPNIKLRLDNYGNALLVIGIIIIATAALSGANDPTLAASVFWLPVIALDTEP